MKYNREKIKDYILNEYDIPINVEQCYVVILRENKPVKSFHVAGGSKFSVEIVEETILKLVTGRPFVIVHTHPTYMPEPSSVDRDFSRDFRNRVGPRFVDHLVITPKSCESAMF